MDTSSPTNVAIVCQGGGSHTAFTAGVLRRLLRERDPEYRIAALSGTSGGAMCAFATWYGLRTGGREKAVRLLDVLWDEIAATDPVDRVANRGLVSSTRLFNRGFPVWRVRSATASRLGKRRLRTILESLVDDAPLADLQVDRPPADPDEPYPPKVLVSAVDVSDGSFRVFTDRAELEAATDERSPDEHSRSTSGRRTSRSTTERRIEERPKPITIDAVIASAAVPPLFEPVEIPSRDGTTHAYWDGLFSQNPPVRNILSGPGSRAAKPDEIWIVRINPTQWEGPFTSLEAIADRRNELAGSLSLYQELYFISQVNEWLDDPEFGDAFHGKFKPVTVRQIELDERRLDPPRELVTATKLDRDPTLIAALDRAGQRQAEAFLRDRDAYTVVD